MVASELLVFLLVMVAPILVGHRVGLNRGHEVIGLAAGLLFSWLGVVAVMVLWPAEKRAGERVEQPSA